MIIAIIVAAIIITLTLLWVSWYVFMSNIDGFNNQHGMMLFEIDHSHRRIRIIPNSSTRYIPKEFYRGDKSGKWEPYKKLTNLFSGTKGESKFRTSLHKLVRNDDFYETSFTFQTKHKKGFLLRVITTSYVVNMHKIEDSNLIGMSISYSVKFQTKNKQQNAKTFSAQEISKLQWTYKGFVSFLVSENQTKKIKEITNIIYNFYSGSRFIYVTNNIITIISVANDKEKIKKLLKKDRALFNKKSFKVGLSQYITGSAYIYARDINTNARLNKIMKSQDYFLNISAKNNIPFISREHRLFQRDEYNAFIEGSKEFRHALKTMAIIPVKHPIRKATSNRKILDFIEPKIDNISSSIFSLILKNNKNKKILRDVAAKKFTIEKPLKNFFMIDVSDDWFFNHISKITQKNAIYIINISKDIKIDRFIANVKLAREAGLELAIRIKNADNDIRSIIKKSDIQFIVIDKQISKNLSNTSVLVAILSVKELIDSRNVRLIFEDPNIKEKERSKQIGLKFYFSTNEEAN